MGKPLTYLFTLVCAVALVGCQEDVPDAELIGTLWTLQSIELPGEPDVAPEATKVYNIQFFEGYRLKGREDCNGYGGIYALSENFGIRLDSLGISYMLCAPPTLGHPYFETLRVVDSYEITGSTLRLHSENGTVLRYRNME